MSSTANTTAETNIKVMNDATFDAVAQRFRILSEPLRLRILQHLRQSPASVGEIVEAIGTSQPNVSKHLSLLAAEGLVERRQEGTSAYYAIVDDSIFHLCELVCDGVERDLERRQQALAG